MLKVNGGSVNRLRVRCSSAVVTIALCVTGQVTVAPAPALADSYCLTPVSAGSGSYQAPPPMICDRPGRSQDSVDIPKGFVHPQSGFGGYSINGESAAEGRHYTTDVAKVTITADFNSGTWTHNFSDAPGPASPGTLTVRLSRCFKSISIVIVRLAFTDGVDGLDGLDLAAKSVRSDGLRLNDSIQPVADGGTVEFYPNGDGRGGPGNGLISGTWSTTILEKSSGAEKATVTYFVGPCGAEVPPPGDPWYGSTGHGTPTGRVWQPSCGKSVLKGSMSTKGVSAKGKSEFRYTFKKWHGKRPVSFKMRNGLKRPKVTQFKGVPRRAVVTLAFKKGSRWQSLSSATNHACG